MSKSKSNQYRLMAQAIKIPAWNDMQLTHVSKLGKKYGMSYIGTMRLPGLGAERAPCQISASALRRLIVKYNLGAWPELSES